MASFGLLVGVVAFFGVPLITLIIAILIIVVTSKRRKNQLPPGDRPPGYGPQEDGPQGPPSGP